MQKNSEKRNQNNEAKNTEKSQFDRFDHVNLMGGYLVTYNLVTNNLVTDNLVTDNLVT